MKWQTYGLLAILGFGLAFAVAQFQKFPGYLDSDYYFAGGVQLAEGKGFTEPYLWNYLDNPSGLPHASHAYWMPLSSIITAGGLWLMHQDTYQAGRIGFLLLAALVPVITAALAYRFTRRGDLALISGLLAVFSVYYVPFLPVSDNYGPYLVLGGLFFMAMSSRKPLTYLALGALAGLLTLARSDGLLWFGLAVLLIAGRWLSDRRIGAAGLNLLLAAIGFLLIVGPWFWHTYSIYGTPLAPGGGHLLWLTSYDQTFIYPAKQLTFEAWLAQGWGRLLAPRLMALRWNLLNAFAAQGGIFLLPFMLIGIWINRKDARVRIAVIGWAGLLFVMTVIFPFAGARGGFFHSGAAFQPLWWTLAPVGLDDVVTAARKRLLFTPAAFKVFQGALVGITVLMTAVIIWLRVLPGWGEGEQNYPRVEAFLQQNGKRADDVVMVRNPPGYYLMTGSSAIVVPFVEESAMYEAAVRYGAKYLIIEPAGAAGPIKSVYDNKNSQRFSFLGNIDGIHIFKIAR